MVRQFTPFLVVVLLANMIYPVYAGPPIGIERTLIGVPDEDLGFCLDFDGINDHINFTYDESLRLVSNLTLEAWVKWDVNPSPTKHDTVMRHDTAGETEDTNVLYGLLMQDDGKIFFIQEHAGGHNDHVTTVGNGYFTLDEWVHLIVVRDQTNLNILFYVDGVLEETIGFDEGASGGSSGAFCIGATWSAPTYDPLDGMIDEVRVYSRAINQTEVTYSYNSGDGIHTPLDTSDLKLWLHFNEGVGTAVLDETVNDNDGTIIGDGDEWTPDLYVPISLSIYPSGITVTDVEEGLNMTLWSGESGVCWGVSNSEEIVSLTLPNAYRYASFNGEFRLYDGSNFIFTVDFLGVRGGDEYELLSDPKNLIMAFMLIGLFIAVALIVLVKHNKS